MAHQVQHSFRYRNFTILKDQTLGHGSYGAVYKAKCDQLTCAAKVLHPTIVDSYDPGSERILQRFQQECDFLNQIRHPHIVQYLGVCRDPDSNLPALLMELLDGSLTKMLEHSPHPISYHIQVDLCHHIALAIAYLHSNGIIHRDLSGNNVLVIAGRRAKVTDFGMSRIVGTQHHLTPLTLCPGTLGYMSPESLNEPPRYTEKLDVFSQGVIIIQVCTRQFPDPGPPMKEIEDSRFDIGTIKVPIRERERRKNHIDLINPTHPLLPIALACLEYRERDRPSAEELCQKLADLKENQEYIESSQTITAATPEVNEALQKERDDLARQVEEKDQEIAMKDEQIAMKDEQIAMKDNEIEIKDEQLEMKDQQLTAKDQQIVTKEEVVERYEIQLHELNQRLVYNKQVTAQFQDTNQQLQGQIQELQKKFETLQGQHKLVPKPIVLQWRGGGKVFSSTRGSSAVASNLAYFRSLANVVYSYDSSSSRWDNLPLCPHFYGTLAVVRGLLTMVGGKQGSNHEITNKLVSLTDDGKWVEQFPPMPTCCCFATATTYQNHLIVAGGSLSITERYVDTVKVLNTDSLVWSTAASLPHPLAVGSATIASGRLYILGGEDRNGKHCSVLSCSLEKLIESCQRLGTSSLKVWQHDTNIPVYGSTCTTVRGQLVAVGGEDEHGAKKTTAVYKYDAKTRSWAIISHMTSARSLCYVVTMETTNQLMVVGGNVNTIEIAKY